ncbi:MAG: hypothetical protein QOI83_1701 [Streptomycetaceae bacterium]|jgi:hypothetical protein|nr:hypothetical protein [Streptomycetaceae bacterium]
MTYPFAPPPDGRAADRPEPKTGRGWTKEKAGAWFAGVAAFAFARDIAFGTVRQLTPDHAYTVTVLVSLIAAVIAYRLALGWLKRLP